MLNDYRIFDYQIKCSFSFFVCLTFDSRITHKARGHATDIEQYTLLPPWSSLWVAGAVGKRGLPLSRWPVISYSVQNVKFSVRVRPQILFKIRKWILNTMQSGIRSQSASKVFTTITASHRLCQMALTSCLPVTVEQSTTCLSVVKMLMI